MSDADRVWGRRPVLEALHAGRVDEIRVASGRRPSPVLDEILALARSAGVPVLEVPSPEISALAPEQTSQGIVARLSGRPDLSLDDLLALSLQSERASFLLALDQVQDPHNLGALVRTANAAGVHGVLTPERRSASLTGVATKVSAGALMYTPVVEVGNFAHALNDIQAAGIWVVGLDGSAHQPLYSIDLTEPVAVVIGGEGTGLRRLTRHHCDFIARLPMLGEIQSLNASVAGGIAMYEVVRQRQAG